MNFFILFCSIGNKLLWVHTEDIMGCTGKNNEMNAWSNTTPFKNMGVFPFWNFPQSHPNKLHTVLRRPTNLLRPLLLGVCVCVCVCVLFTVIFFEGFHRILLSVAMDIWSPPSGYGQLCVHMYHLGLSHTVSRLPMWDRPTDPWACFVVLQALTQHCFQGAMLTEKLCGSKQDLLQTTRFINTIKQ